MFGHAHKLDCALRYAQLAAKLNLTRGPASMPAFPAEAGTVEAAGSTTLGFAVAAALPVPHNDSSKMHSRKSRRTLPRELGPWPALNFEDGGVCSCVKWLPDVLKQLAKRLRRFPRWQDLRTALHQVRTRFRRKAILHLMYCFGIGRTVYLMTFLHTQSHHRCKKTKIPTQQTARQAEGSTTRLERPVRLCCL